MKKLVINLATVSILAIATQSSVLAEDLANSPVRVKAGIDLANYTSPITGANTIKFNYKSLNVGASYFDASSGKFIDFTNRSSLGSSTWNTSTVLIGGIPDSLATRTENTLTIGKVLDEGTQVFGGYQTSEAFLNFDSTNNQSYPASQRQQSYLALHMSGFFVGVGKTSIVGAGTFNLMGSLSMMGAQGTNANGTWSGGQTFSAGLGYSLGVSWSYAVNNTLSVVPELKIQSYSPQGYGTDTLTSYGVNVISKF